MQKTKDSAISSLSVSRSKNTLDNKSSRWHVLMASWLGTMFDGMDASIFVLILFPALSDILHTTSYTEVGLAGSIVMATFMFGWAIGAIAFGIIADYIGRTKTMMLTILLYASATGLCALSHSYQELAFYRFLVGLGIGGEVICGAILVSECWRNKSRVHAVGVLTSAFGAGYLVAALLNLVLSPIGWRWLFVAGIAPALVTLYIRSKVSEPLHFELNKEYKKRLREKEKSSLTQEEKELLSLTVVQIFNKENIVQTLKVSFITSVMIIGYWAVLAWVPPWINQLTGTSAIVERSLAAALFNVGAITGNCLSGSIINFMGRRKSFMIFFMGAFISASTMFLTIKSFGPILLAAMTIAGFFASGIFGYIYIYTPELFKARIRGTAFGFSMQVGRFAAAIAALISGQLIAFFNGSYAIAAACLSAVYLLGFIAAFFLPETKGEVFNLELTTPINLAGHKK
jgi:MFS family permease